MKSQTSTKKAVKGNRLFFKPEGWVDNLTVELGSFRCGQETNGLFIGINDQAGGVLSRTDMKILIKVFKEHLKQFPLPTYTKKKKSK